MALGNRVKLVQLWVDCRPGTIAVRAVKDGGLSVDSGSSRSSGVSEVGRVRSPGRTHDGQGALAFRIPEGIF